MMTTLVVGAFSCSSDNEEGLDPWGGSEKSVKEEIALAMAAGTYNAAYLLDTIKAIEIDDGIRTEYSIKEEYGASHPQRGEYLEIKGNKILSPAQLYREQDGLAKLAYKLMTGEDGENYIEEYFIEHDFRYDILTSRIGPTRPFLANFDLIYADDNSIVIREISEIRHNYTLYHDYYFVRTAPREISGTFKDSDEAWEFFKQKLIEFVGEEKFNELLENSSQGPFC